MHEERKMFVYDETRAAELVGLVRLARDGDQASMEEVCRRFAPLVAGLAGRAHLRTIREEAVTVGWLAVVEAVRRCPERLLPRFPGYVKRYAAYRIWNLFKHERFVWRHEISDENRERTGGDPAEKSLDLPKALATLPTRWRRIVEWNIVSGLPLRIIADRLGISPQMVQKLREKALHRLRKQL